MTMRRILATLSVFLVTLMGALVVSAQPAAAAAPGNCANSSVCGYGDRSYTTGQGYEFATFPGAGVCDNIGLPNQWTSVYNNSGRTVRLYRNANCGNGVWTLTSGSGLNNMGLWQPSWNNTIESIRW